MMKLEMIQKAADNLKTVVIHTPLVKNENLSERFDAQVYLKREDLQPVRSYKLRGAYNKISMLSTDEKHSGVVCASAGNHAQGVAFACRKLNVKAVIYMPVTTPAQKIKQVKLFGKENLFHITRDEMYHMNSNVFSIAPDVVVSEKNFTRLNNWLREKGFTVEEIPYAEIAKQEGLLRCSTLPLIRD